ncbi:hypothetical protein Tco_0695177 [Tanacetum coccineum]
MNPDTKKTMKHANLLSKSSRVNFKRVITRSSSNASSNSTTDSSVEGKDTSGELELGCGMDDNGSNELVGFQAENWGSIMDKTTTSIFERPYWRVSFARVLVDVDAIKGLVDGVEVCACGKRDQTVGKSGDKVEANMSSTNKNVNVQNDNDGWQNVVNRRNGRGGMSYYRQGSTNFNHNRGGGMSGRGRGYYASRFKPNNVNNGVNIGNKQYVPVNWNSEKLIIVDESMVANEVKKNDDSDENKQNLRETRKVSGNGKTGGIKLKGSVENRNVNTKNRFEVLGEEKESEDSDSWKEVKIHVDVACDMGIPVSKILLLTKISDLDAEIEHLKKNLLVNAGMNAQRMVNDSEEATGEKVNGVMKSSGMVFNPEMDYGSGFGFVSAKFSYGAFVQLNFSGIKVFCSGGHAFSEY